ncbi:hypothetical protein CTAYLR_009368 [Chrysophaeum taylorii]|uniref:Diaminopelargonic acid synthase n=1 Tax=Chrysophaeum taylorii TaxID=2483200 RepID=A0AAD7UC90_9STRA|nr:hypothetical protein CTAYLR_009368 [Chrysophaeum taylorii]
MRLGWRRTLSARTQEATKTTTLQRAWERPLGAHLAADAAHVWHPYTSAARRSRVWSVASAHGVRLRLESGEEVVDGMSSWWAAVHGYNHERLNAAATEQLSRCSHVMFGGLTHRPGVALCEQLVEIAPGADLSRVFLCDSGSVAVEVAIKLALQYWRAAGRDAKTRLLATRGAYHGDTFGAMACCDPINGMHAELFSAVLPRHVFAPRPDSRFGARPGLSDLRRVPSREGGAAADELERLIEAHADELAAVILEPLVQGAGGMWFYDPDYLRRARRACRDHGVLLIADEIATGFGRTGDHLFACQHADVEPDILCVGKALTGGYLSMAATLATDRVAMADRENAPPLMHGPTFMANPLAAAIAGASLDLLISPDYDWRAKVAAIERQLIDQLAPCRASPAVADVRVLGAIGVVELAHAGHDHSKLAEAFVRRGVWLRSFRNLIYTMPPFVIQPRDLAKITWASRVWTMDMTIRDRQGSFDQ